MPLLAIMFNILLIILITLLFINFIMSKKNYKNREKMTPFECGYDPLLMGHPPFSIQFFLISLIFLIFDVEITLLIPLIFLMMSFNFFTVISFTIFILILIYGLYLEYMEQSIDWKN